MDHQSWGSSAGRESDELQAMSRMLGADRIAIVGLSDDPSRPSHRIAQYLLAEGKQVTPINPMYQEVMGLKCHPSLEEAPSGIEVVNVFRRPEHCPAIVRSAIAIGAKGVWLQSGIISKEGKEIARDAGIDFVQDRCIMVEHASRR